MLFQIAFILVAIGILSILWTAIEVLAVHLYAIEYKKSNRSKSVRKRFDK